MTTLTPHPSRIYLMRHAAAGPVQPGRNDFDRTLDETGFAEADRVADIAADRRYVPDLVMSSTAIRCRQTVDALRRAISVELEIRYVDDLYFGSPETYVDIVAAQNGVTSVLIVGHNPAMEHLLETLIGTDAVHQHLPAGYPTAAFVVLDEQASGTEGGNPAWVLTDVIRP